MESSSLLLPISKKSVSSLILLFLLINFFEDFRSEAQVLPDDEVRTLQQIQTKLNIKMWGNVDPNYCSKTKSLSNSKNSDTLNNVTCDCTYNASTICHVTSIQLRGMNLTGVLPDEFANLTHLQQIDLARNYLNGTIPRSWTTLPLVNLSVLGNIVSGQIPIEIGDIATLEALILEDNRFDGPLPREIGKLSRLSRFLASGNNFYGTLPETFGDLKNLTTFRIDGTSISGRIPSFIGNWTQMERLDMQGTSMEGPIPANISLLTNLKTLKVSDLNISSMTFPGLQAQTQMEELILRNCSINGSIPSYIGEVMPNLARLDLSYNRLSGNIPGSLEQSKSLRFMYLNNNSLTGKVPTWISSTGYNFDISYNNFTGSSKSSCRENNLNRISIYSSLEDKSIDWCLKKDLPCPGKPKYHNLFVNCGGPRLFFEGEDYEQNVDKMSATSFISTDKWACSSTGAFVLHSKTDYIARATTNISGGELYSTARLAPNSLRYFGLCLRKGSYTVKLHFAEIIITDDQTSARRFFDISIQGKRIWKDYNIAEKAGGVGKSIVETYIANVTGSTLEIHLYWSGKGTTAIPYRSVHGPLISAITVTPNFDPHSGGLSVGIIVGIVAASCVVVVLVLVILWKKGYLGGKDNEDKELRPGLELHTGYFSLRQIKAATGNFDNANKIGEGGFGTVYKGVLSDGSIIAVKQLSSKSKQGNREFVNEIGMISALQHLNLVKLFGCCIEGNQLLLIYEYMENNSLARTLFGREEEKLNLDWPTRLKICMGIARGLAYLHEESRLKIVHRDIKATNVLLDRDLNAKISDFGLAKLVEEENSHISTRVAGTIGYMAPEYAMRGYLTDKADVYSFGVVALEIVSGKSNTNFRPIEKIAYLLDWAYVLQEQGNLLELVDPSLGAMYSKEEALRMLNVGLLCTNLSPTLRPTMSAVVSMLDGQAPIQAPLAKHGSMTDDIMFKAFENISQDSQTQISSSSHDSQMQSMSTDGTWIDSSSVTFYSIEETKEHSSTNKLLPDFYEVNLI